MQCELQQGTILPYMNKTGANQECMIKGHVEEEQNAAMTMKSQSSHYHAVYCLRIEVLLSQAEM